MSQQGLPATPQQQQGVPVQQQQHQQLQGLGYPAGVSPQQQQQGYPLSVNPGIAGVPPTSLPPTGHPPMMMFQQPFGYFHPPFHYPNNSDYGWLSTPQYGYGSEAGVFLLPQQHDANRVPVDEGANWKKDFVHVGTFSPSKSNRKKVVFQKPTTEPQEDTNYCGRCHKKAGHNKKNCARLGFAACDGTCDRENCSVKKEQRAKERKEKQQEREKENEKKKIEKVEKKRKKQEKLDETDRKRKKKNKCKLSLKSLPSRVHSKALLGMVKTFTNENNLVEKAASLAERFDVKNSRSTDSGSVLGQGQGQGQGQGPGSVSGSGSIVGSSVGSSSADFTNTEEEKDKAIEELLREEELDLVGFNKALFKEGETEPSVERNLDEEALLVSSDDDSVESLDDDEALDIRETVVFLIERVTVLSENVQLIKSSLGLK